MACFLVTTTEAVVTTLIKKGTDNNTEVKASEKHPFLKRLGRLNNMLWGGSALLALEHVWHGEVTPWFPFLTAAADPGETMQMLHEMATTGIAMAALVTAVWAGTVLVEKAIVKKAAAESVEVGGDK
jgi:hypothetical protein